MAATNSIALIGAINSTNNVAQLLGQTTPSNDSSGNFHVSVAARRASDGATKIWNFDGGWKRIGSAAPTINSQLLNILGETGDLLALLLTAVTIDVNSNNVRIMVTGLNTTSIDWGGTITGFELTP